MRTKKTEEMPAGLRYIPDLITVDEEEAAMAAIEAEPLHPMEMHGVSSKRLVEHYGFNYDYAGWTVEKGKQIPPFLTSLRETAASAAEVSPASLEEALITKYPQGAGIGWHRDAPMFGSPVIGISLASACEFRFRRKTGDVYELFKIMLEPRSCYIMGGEARGVWQHSIDQTPALRYSITFRTVKRKGRS